MWLRAFTPAQALSVAQPSCQSVSEPHLKSAESEQLFRSSTLK